ncbi:MAG TPA: hypothetical protein VM096_07040 [Vicinamibacterales bacterium]|nr:hypothetical protein [Vicinamibacterales bacterium]
MQPDGAVNLGTLIRNGIRLSTAEVVSVLYGACKQLEAGLSAALPQHPDELWVTDIGTVAVTSHDAKSNPRSAVASLLEILLPKASDQPEFQVPSALRTLPARLRAAGAASGTDYKDLIAIFARYLPVNHKALIEQLARRAVTSTPAMAPVAAAPIAAAPIVSAPIAAPPIAAPPIAAAPIAAPIAAPVVPITTAPAATAAVKAVAPIAITPIEPIVTRRVEPIATDHVDSLPLNTPEVRVVHTPSIATAAHHPKRRLAPLIALALLLMLLSGYFGYRYSQSTAPVESASAPSSEGAEPIDAPPTTPRIIVVPSATSTATPPVAEDRRVPEDRALVNVPAAAQPVMIDATDGAFSPSFGTNHTMLFHTGRVSSGRIVSTTIDDRGRASNTTELFDDGANNYHPRLSPDGRLLAFDSDRDGERGVYVSQRNGSEPRRISGDGYAAVPSWSPDGRQLAFIKAEPGRSKVWNLWVLNLASGDLRRHSAFRSGQVWGASWFPDGRRVAYSHEDQLVIADLTTGTATNVGSPVARHLVRTPAVSPDGRQIVFQVFHDGGWVLDVATGRMRRVLDDASAEEFVWEPGGRRVAFHSRRDGQWRIWLMTI